MRLAPNWRRIVRYGWSFRLIIIVALLSGAEAALPLFLDSWPMPPGLTVWLVFFISLGAAGARLIFQVKVSGEPWDD